MDCRPPKLLVLGFSRQEYWSELPCPPPGDLPDPGIKPTVPALAGRFFMAALPRKTTPQIVGIDKCVPDTFNNLDY